MKKIRYKYVDWFYPYEIPINNENETLTEGWLTCRWENTQRSIYVSYRSRYDDPGFYITSGWYPFVTSNEMIYDSLKEAYNALEQEVANWISGIEETIQNDKNIPDDAYVEVFLSVGRACRYLLEKEPLNSLRLCDVPTEIYNLILKSFPDIFDNPSYFVKYGRQVLCDDEVYCSVMESIVFPKLILYSGFSRGELQVVMSEYECDPSVKADVYEISANCKTEEEWWNVFKSEIVKPIELLKFYLLEDKEKAKRFIDWVF